MHRCLSGIAAHNLSSKRAVLLLALLAFSWLGWSPLPQWLDSAELTLSATHLGIAHPPGQPLFSLLMHIVNYLPFSTPPLRICFLLSLMHLAALLILLKAVQLVPSSRFNSLMLTLLAVLPVGQLQLCRQELYAVNLLFFAISLAIAAEDFYLLCFITGLAICNHTLLGVASGGVLMIWTHLQKPMRLKPIRHYGWGATFLLAGLLPYLYLPIRAAVAPAINFANPDSWERFFWVISGQLYAAYSDGFSIGLWWGNLKSVIGLYGRFLTPLFFIVAVIGWWQLLRKKIRPHLGALLLVVASILAVLPNNQLNVTNPDLFGYLLPGFMLFTLIGFSFFVPSIVEAKDKGGSHRMLMHIVIGALLLFAISRSVIETAAYRTPQTDRFVNLIDDTLPEHSDVVLSSYATYSQLRYFQAVESYRRDLRLQFRGDPNSFPMQEDDLLAWSKERRLFLELSPMLGRDGQYQMRDSAQLLSYLQPAGWFFAVQPSPGSQAGLAADFTRQKEFWRSFDAVDGMAMPAEWQRRLFLAHALHHLFYATRGFNEGAIWEQQFGDLTLQEGFLTTPQKNISY